MTEQTFSPKAAFRTCIQVGVVVRDVERKIEALSRIFGMGPFTLIDYPPASAEGLPKVYHDQPGQYTARIAFASLGTLDLELIEPVQGPSIWQDFLDTHGEGIHHIKFCVSDEKPVLDHLAAHGVDVEMWGSSRAGTAYYYLDSQAQAGFTIELMRIIRSAE